MSTAARWLRRAAWTAGASCAALALALGALALHNARASRAFWARPDPRGRLVELGSRRVFASVSGLREQRGPTVVLIAGFGPSAEWWTLADMIAPHAAVLSY